MSNTQNIPVPFAQSGTQTAIPTTSTAGQVNLSQGYTSNYSLSLTSNPNALPVERDKFNWLMNLVTTNIIDWQTVAVPQWNSSVSYYAPSLVRYSTSSTAGSEKLYRCIATPPAGTPPTSTAYWEVTPTSTALIGMIPEPDQGQIIVATNLNSVAKGWYEINGVVQACPNAPPTTDTSGVFECYNFGTPNMIFQRFVGAGGNSFVRTFDGANWHGWNQVAYRGTTLESYGITNGLWGRGTDLTSTSNLNTIQPTTGEVHVMTSAPGGGNANFPVTQPGVLFAIGYNLSSSANMTAQTYMGADGSLWARLCVNSVWQAWAPIAFNVQTYINNLLASNNVWTGTNQFNNAVNSTLANGLTWNNVANANASPGGSAGFSGTAGSYKYNYIVNVGGSYGIYNPTNNTWSLNITDQYGTVAFDSAVLSLNNNRARGSVSFLQGCIPTTTSAAARIQFESNGTLSFYALNGNLNGFANRAYVDTGGNFSTTGGASIFSSGNFYSNGGSGAVFGGDGNISGSSIISATRGRGYSDLNSAINDQYWYVMNANQTHNVKLYWDGNLEEWVDGGYQGTIATQSWTSANFWNSSSFLRPDQGSWGGTTISPGTSIVTLPGGGAWAYLYFDMVNSGVSRFACGVAAGGSQIFNSGGGGSVNWGLFFRWRIY